MYFVHPQIKFNIGNLWNLFLCFLKKPDQKGLDKIKEMFPKREIYFTDMGRSAFRLIVEKLGLQNSQMLVPAYICDVFYPIFRKYNISPIFLDIDKRTFNIKPEEIEKGLKGRKVKSILVCHTYGKPANLEKILDLAKKYNLKVIEDCAHSFGLKIGDKYAGNFGDAALFSLYKQFPSLRGGMAVLKNKKLKIKNKKYLVKTHFNFRDFVSLLNCFSFFSFLFKKYGGKIAQKHIRKEKLSGIGELNRVSLNIFLWQLKNFEKTLEKRKKLALYFREQLKKLGFETQSNGDNIFTPLDSKHLTGFTFLSALVPENIDRDKFIIILRKKRVFALRIWREPIILSPEFPNTMEVAKRIVNFPLQNWYRKKDVNKIVKIAKVTLREVKGESRLVSYC